LTKVGISTEFYL